MAGAYQFGRLIRIAEVRHGCEENILDPNLHPNGNDARNELN